MQAAVVVAANIRLDDSMETSILRFLRYPCLHNGSLGEDVADSHSIISLHIHMGTHLSLILLDYPSAVGCAQYPSLLL